MKLAVFDCDGTLVDGQASICEAMEAAFARDGRKLRSISSSRSSALS